MFEHGDQTSVLFLSLLCKHTKKVCGKLQVVALAQTILVKRIDARKEKYFCQCINFLLCYRSV